MKKDTRNYGKNHPRFAEGGTVSEDDWHKQATAEAEKLGPSASGRASPIPGDDFFKGIPGVRGTVDSYNAMREVEADPKGSFEMLRQLQRGKE